MSDNLDIWKGLAKTDPDQVKDFQRAGGFRGHAVKPIYVIQKMTQTFGPCGVGWVIGKPDFTTVATDEGLVSVHCTVSVSVRLPGTDELSAPIYGVGGDHVVAGRKNGKFVDDESFKKAFTDAIGNALKFLGMSADIHMGRFEDSKYVAALREEKAEARQARANGNGNGKPKNGGYQDRYVKPQDNGAPPPCGPDDLPSHDPQTGELTNGFYNDLRDQGVDPDAPIPPALIRGAKELLTAIESADSLTRLGELDHNLQQVIGDFSDRTKDRLAAAMKARVQTLSEAA